MNRLKTKTAQSSVASRGFNANQLRKLQKCIDQRHVHVREAEGRQLSYIEGWYAISQANEIFGYAAWDRETVFLERASECVKSDVATCGYIARVRIKVRAGTVEVSREGTGFGIATARTLGAAQERALKSAETDATKRALSTFGAQFGLSLYDKQGAPVGRLFKCVLFSPTGQPFADNLSPEAFATGLRQLIEKCQSPAEVSALVFWNNGPLSGLRLNAPDLRNNQGMHFTDLLLRLAERAIRRMEAWASMPRDPGAEDVEEVMALSAPHGAVAEAEIVSEKIVPLEAAAAAEAASKLNSSEEPGAATISVGIAVMGRATDQPVDIAEDPKIVAHLEVLPQETPPAIEDASRIGHGERIDKGSLTIGFERRVRSKLHLRRVAELPCLVCNRQPSHAHHVKFAQRRGLSQKVSDEFVVPLCAIHHGDLHGSGSERDWWQKQGHDPLAIAAELWNRYGRNLN